MIMAQSHYSLTWEAHVRNVCDGLSNLQQNGEFVDMTLAADGHMVKVHQVVMALASPYFKDLIISAQCPHPVIVLNKVTHATLSAILEYIYTGEVLVSLEHLNDLIQAAKELHIKGLKDMKIHPTLMETSKQLAQPGEEVLEDEDLCLLQVTHKIENNDDNPEQPQEDNMMQFEVEAVYDNENLTPQGIEQEMEERQDLLSEQDQDLLSEQDQDLLIEQDHDLILEQDDVLLSEQDHLLISEQDHDLLTDDHNLLREDHDLLTEDHELLTEDHNLLLEEDPHLVSEQDHDLLSEQDPNSLSEQDQDFNETISPVTPEEDQDEVLDIEQLDEEMLDSESDVPNEIDNNKLNQECSTLQYTVSNRGSLQMILNRFVYYLKHTNMDRSRQWRCVDYLSHVAKCPALVFTKDDMVVHRIAAHTHPFHDSKIMKKLKSGAVFSAYMDAKKEGDIKKKTVVTSTGDK